MKRLFLFVLLCFLKLNGNMFYEGTETFRNYGRVDYNWFVQFLPYNPVIVEVGAYCGAETCIAKTLWPKSKVYAFEPNPRAFAQLQNTIIEKQLMGVKPYNIALNHYNGDAILYVCHGLSGTDPSYEPLSSLLPPLYEVESHYRGPKLEVPCVVLDDWCRQNRIDHIDILKLETEGNELQILQSSPNILKRTKMIHVQTFFHPFRKDMTYYFHLKDYLIKANFVVLAHWYEQGGRGNAVYISQELFEAYFVRSLGLGSGGLNYP